MSLPRPPQSNPTGDPGPEQTLRLIARLPAPQGLEDRVLARLAAKPRPARVFFWPSAGGLHSRGWVHSAFARGAAAAAIVCVVTGGAWQVYLHVPPPPQAKVRMMPRTAAPGTGFSSANAVRTPKTLEGPTLHTGVSPQPLAAHQKRRATRKAAKLRPDAAGAQPALPPQ
jgi:hypothetical protein